MMCGFLRLTHVLLPFYWNSLAASTVNSRLACSILHKALTDDKLYRIQTAALRNWQLNDNA